MGQSRGLATLGGQSHSGAQGEGASGEAPSQIVHKGCGHRSQGPRNPGKTQELLQGRGGKETGLQAARASEADPLVSNHFGGKGACWRGAGDGGDGGRGLRWPGILLSLALPASSVGVMGENVCVCGRHSNSIPGLGTEIPHQPHTPRPKKKTCTETVKGPEVSRRQPVL